MDFSFIFGIFIGIGGFLISIIILIGCHCFIKSAVKEAIKEALKEIGFKAESEGETE